MSNSTTTLTFSLSTEMNSADQIQHKLSNALEQCADVLADIEKTGPDLVVYRGREIKKQDVLADLVNMIALTEKVELYVHQFSKTLDASSRI